MQLRLFLQRVIAEQAFPLELKVPNAQTVAAMEEARQLMAEKSLAVSDAQAMFDELEQKH
jgi:DNA-damage-inducible protein J